MNYDPADHALAWSHPDTLLVAHLEQYSSADLFTHMCEGSGIYAVPVGGAGSPRPIGVGEPACRAVASDGGVAMSASARQVLASENVPVNRSQLVLTTLPDGPLDTLATGCQIYAEDPDLSPDERAIAFRGLCTGREQEEWELYVVGADGAGLRQIPGEDGHGVATPRWSADGSRLAYVRTRGVEGDYVEEVALVDTSGLGRRVLARGSAPAWSPAGAWVAYLAEREVDGGAMSIRIILPDGTGDREVFRNRERSTFSRGWGPSPEGQPGGPLVWSPDGRWIAFSRRYDRGETVWRVSIETGEARQVTERQR